MLGGMRATLPATNPATKILRPLAERLRKVRSAQPAKSYPEWLAQASQGASDSRPDMQAKKLR